MLIFWAVIFAAALLVEALTAGLTTVWFAAGALTAFVAALCSAPIWVQAALFVAVSLLLLIFIRPLLRKLFPVQFQATNFDRCIGKTAVAEERIDNLAGTGSLRIDGVLWTARCEKEEDTAEKGELVRIVRIEGVKAFVEPLRAEPGGKA